MPIRRASGVNLIPKGFQEVRKGDGTIIWQPEPNPSLDSPHTLLYDEGTYESDWESVGSGGSWSKESDHLYALSESSFGSVTWYTSATVDISNTNEIGVAWEIFQNSKNAKLLVNDGKTLPSDPVASTSITATGKRTDFLDVSGVSGSYYIGVNADSDGNSPVEWNTYQVALMDA